MKDLLNSLKTGQEDFTTISAGLAHLKLLSLGLLEKLRNLKQLITEHLNQKKMAYFAQEFLVQ